MCGKSVIFGDKKIKINNFHKNQKIFKIDDIDVKKLLVSKEEPYDKKNSFKYLIGYNNDVVRPLCIKIPQTIGYVRCFESNKTMSFGNNKLLKNYTQIWKKVKNLLNIKFDNEPVYGNNDKYIKTKIKINDNNVNKNFHGKKVSKENSLYECLSLIMLDSVAKVKRNHCHRILLE